MTGWSNGGVRQKVLSGVHTLGELGGDSGMKKLMAAAKEKGLFRLEGKEYVMQDGDVTMFRFNV